MSSGSDVEISSVLPKKIKKKIPKSPSVELLKDSEPKKASTKDMIYDALKVLNTRKGVSLYAIKKYLTEKYNVDTPKINYLIKKTIKSELENGNIVQTKGVGAAGSFKLAPKKKIEKPIKKKKTQKIKKAIVEKEAKKTKESEKSQQVVKKTVKNKSESGKITKKTTKKEKITKDPKRNEVKKIVKNKMAKEAQTPAKKRAAMIKRKSIGSIIKPPKMKPKAR